MKQLSHHKLSSLSITKEKWCAIIDITIKKGRAKLLSILRVPLNIYDKRAGSIKHNETEILAIFIKETWNGEEVAACLNETFIKYGNPDQIIFDQGSDLNCGVNFLKQAFYQYSRIQVVHDITHLFSNLLKNEYKDNPLFKYFMKKSSRTGTLVRQTVLSKITPPKLRRLGRFHSIIRPIEWGLNAIHFYKVHKRKCKTKFQKKLKKSLSWIPKMKIFLSIIYEKCELLNSIQGILKNNGMNQKNYQLCVEKVNLSPTDVEFKNKIIKILRYYIYQASRLSCTINVTSDVLESIYGQYKLFFERSKSTDIVSSALYLPAFAGDLSSETVNKMLLTSKIKDIQEWEKQNLPQSEQSKRLKAPKIFKSYKRKADNRANSGKVFEAYK